MFKATMGRKTKGGGGESAAEIMQLYSTREQNRTRNSQRLPPSFNVTQAAQAELEEQDVKSGKKSHSLYNSMSMGRGGRTSGGKTKASGGHYSLAKTRFTGIGSPVGMVGVGGIETVNVKHRPKSTDRSEGQKTLPRKVKNTKFNLMKSLSLPYDEDDIDINNSPIQVSNNVNMPIPTPIPMTANPFPVAEDNDQSSSPRGLKVQNIQKCASPAPNRRTYSDSTSTHSIDNISSMGSSSSSIRGSNIMKTSSQGSSSSTVKSGSGYDGPGTITSAINASLGARSSMNMKLPKTIGDLKSKYMTAIYAKSEQMKDKQSENADNHNVAGKEESLRGIGKSDFAFKQAMLDKYQFLNGGGIVRKNSSFNQEATKILLIGPAKSGKSTIYKELLGLGGYPPNFARAYVPTKEPVEKELRIDEDEFLVTDVGGDKKEMLKWRFYLSSSDLILFVVAIDEYDRNAKNSTKNSLEESIELFESIINNIAVMNSKIYLILNKADRFKKRLCDKNIKLGEKGGKFDIPPPEGFDYEEGIKWVQDLFMKKIEDSEHVDDVHIEVTTAVDSDTTGRFLKEITEDTAKGHKANKWRNLL